VEHRPDSAVVDSHSAGEHAAMAAAAEAAAAAVAAPAGAVAAALGGLPAAALPLLSQGPGVEEGGAPVGTQAVQQAMQAVGRLSSHLAATQEQLPPLAAQEAGEAAAAEPAVPQPPPAHSGHEPAATAGPDGAVESPARQRRWRQQQGRARAAADSEEEAEDELAGGAAQRRQRAGAGKQQAQQAEAEPKRCAVCRLCSALHTIAAVAAAPDCCLAGATSLPGLSSALDG
jgi:hypothetical protein